ncbi:MAG: BACON domain-containing protein [Chloroflexia bacterium]
MRTCPKLLPALLLYLSLTLSGMASPRPWPTRAEAGVFYVSSVSGDDANLCTDNAPCRTLQRAVDLAPEGSEIRIATLDNLTPAVYTGEGSAVVSLQKNLTLRGGYAYTHTDLPPLHLWTPTLLPSSVDGEGLRRGLVLSGEISPTLELLSFSRGHGTEGGNAYIEGGRARLLGIILQGGNAQRGGGLYLRESQAVLSGVIVQDNQAGEGGGIYVEGGAPNLLGGIVQENAAERGGGLYSLNGALHLAGTLVFSNTASQAGGALYLDGPISLLPEEIPILANSYIRHNRAADGAAVYFHLAVAGLVNTVIADNQATGHGGGLYLWASFPQGFHNTIARNTGSEGLYLTHQPGSLWPPVPPIPSLPTFTNTIIVSHTVGVYVESTGWFPPLENRATLRGTLWWGNGSDTAGPGEFDLGQTNVYSAPLFTCMGDVPACPNPYHLRENSPAVDAGVPIALTLPGTDLFVDIDGQLRPSGAGYDLGADEVMQPAGVVLLPAVSLQTATPGQTVTHTHRLFNTGTATDTYTLTLSSSAGWSGLLTPSPITVGPQTSTTVAVRVNVPATATAGLSETGILSAVSWANPLLRADALERTTVVTAPSPYADLRLAKSPDASAIGAGEAVHFTLTITNAGPFSETLAVTLTDTVVPTSAVALIGAPAGCQVHPPAVRVTCTLALPAGSPPVTAGLILTLTTTPSYTGPLFNAAWVQSSLPDPVPTNNFAQAVVAVGLFSPTVVISPSSLRVTLTAGLSATRGLSITNGGRGTLYWLLQEDPPVSWLEASPLGGTLAPSESIIVAVHLDAGGLGQGLYTTSLQVASNDPLHPQRTVPVALNVRPAGGYFLYLPLVLRAGLR